eukprot:881203-Amorphochlora_amoeboformis.AAC.1
MMMGRRIITRIITSLSMRVGYVSHKDVTRKRIHTILTGTIEYYPILPDTTAMLDTTPYCRILPVPADTTNTTELYPVRLVNILLPRNQVLPCTTRYYRVLSEFA